jgi:carbonic anhydrase
MSRQSTKQVFYSVSILCAVAVAVLGMTRPAWASEDSKAPKVTPDQAIQRLTEGNARYVQEKTAHPKSGPDRRLQTATDGQHPFVTMLSCADSRVPLEVVFDEGLGDIFVVRVAGNVCGVDEIGSIEYGVDHVGTPLMVILGHTQCGAVTAAATHAEVHGSIKALLEHIEPAVATAQAAHSDLHGKDLIPAATEANVWHSIEDLLLKSHTMKECIEKGKVKVVGAIYDIKTGQVRWLGEHPRQSDLLKEKD